MATSVEEGQPGEDRVVVHLRDIIYNIRCHFARTIVRQVASWGNQAAQESTVDGAVVLNSVTNSNMPGDLATPL